MKLLPKSLLPVLMMTLIIGPATLANESSAYRFDHIPNANSWINTIFQDEEGFIWFGTRNGLYRYTEVGMDTARAFEGSNIDMIDQDAEGMLWLHKRNGYVAYNPQTRNSYNEEEAAALLGTEGYITALHVDQEGDLWWIAGNELRMRPHNQSESLRVAEVEAGETLWNMESRDKVLYLLSSDGRIRRFLYTNPQAVAPLEEIVSPDPQSDYLFYRFFIDSRRQIWLLQGSRGVWRYSPLTGLYTEIPSARLGQKGLICSITEDASGAIWIASDHGGITIWQGDDSPLLELKHNPSDNNSIAGNSIYALYRDRNDNIWIGYSKKGASIWRGHHKAYSILHLNSCYEEQLSDDINTICEGLDGKLWFGTDGNGVVCLDPKTGREERFTTANSPLKSNVITTLHCDDEGRIWIGTFIGGLSCYEPGHLRTYHYEGSDEGLASDNIWDIDHTLDGRICLATLGGGFQTLNPASGEFTTYNQYNSGLTNDHIMQMARTEDGCFYLATSHGLSLFDPRTDTIKSIDHEALQGRTLSGLCCDKEGLVWLNMEGDILLYDPIKEEVVELSRAGMEAVQSLLKGSDGTVWAFADNGIGHFYRTDDARLLPRLLRFPDNHFHFNQRSAVLLRDGSMAAGGFNGYMLLTPNLHELGCEAIPDLHFTELYLNNNRIEVGQKVGRRILLERALEHTRHITLAHSENIFSVEFSALNFSSSFRPELRYRLVGRSNEWYTVEEQTPRLTFINLRPGHYTLTLCSQAEQGTTSSHASLEITILPPWWRTPVAICGYLLASLTLVGGCWWVVRRRQRRHYEALEERMRYERKHYSDELKMQFFTNVSHDFRTPLTLILTPLEELMRTSPESHNNLLLTTIHRNAQRLLTLVNQILDLRKLEMYGMQLNLSQGDLVQVIHEVCESFRLHSDHNHIRLEVKSNTPHLVCLFDRDKLIKVLTNLLSNAFKFTPEQGSISVILEQGEGENVELTIADSGCGIPDRDKRHIFDRFYQRKSSGEQTGNGIGLHIAREFVMMHGGEIRVEDNRPQGTRFVITLQLRRGELPSEEQSAWIGEEQVSGAVETEARRSTLLVVDDNADFRAFLNETLKADYEVLTAANGQEALQIVENEQVDLVICDVMMPIMDGVEFCRRIKSEITTSHIPVILLTARAMQEDEYAGLESGADDYITKPFNISILRLRITKFLEWKARAHALFKRQIEVAPEQLTITSLDDRLLQAAIEAVNEQISNPDFSVADLSAHLHMHRTHLYKKLLSLTGKAPLEFIRAIRLKRAAQLLESGQSYIAEVAYMVGFNSPKLFARHFRDEFGCSPSEYQRQHGKRSEN